MGTPRVITSSVSLIIRPRSRIMVNIRIPSRKREVTSRIMYMLRIRFIGGMIHDNQRHVKERVLKAKPARFLKPGRLGSDLKQVYALADQSPCRLQSSRAVRVLGLKGKNASGVSPGLRN